MDPMTPQTAKRWRRIVRRFYGQTIGVLGDFMLDELLQGEATRISPEAPVPVVLADPNRSPEGFPGGAGNVAANIAALGGRAIPFGAIGADAQGKQLVALLRRRGITCTSLIQVPGRSTPHKIRVVAHQHQLLRLDFESPAPIRPATVELLARHVARRIARLRALVISDYRKGSVTAALCQRVFALAQRRQIPTFVDPKPDNLNICQGAMVVTPNLHEAEQMAGVPLREPGRLARAGRQLRRKLDCSYLLVTRGAEGMTLFEPDDSVYEIPSVPRPVYDVTGAGDTVIAVLTLAYCAGASMREAAELANLAAGRVVLKLGTAYVSPPELVNAIVCRSRTD